MQLLLVHSDFMEYDIKKKTNIYEEIEDEKKHMSFNNLLVVFISVEIEDVISKNLIIDKAIFEISKIANQINEKTILIYPYAHLSSCLASPYDSIKILNELEEELKKTSDFYVQRAPFGWYKSFSIKCKGHPLSELSKSIKIESFKQYNLQNDIISEALKSEKDMKSKWYILDTNNELQDITNFNYENYNKLKCFVDYEVSKNRTCNIAPPHVELMKKLELVDYEPGSDSGNLRFYPKGRFIKSLIENFVIEKTTKEYEAMEIETPIMYDMEHPTLKKYLDRFPARQYSIDSDKKKLFLRFAACFGQFLMNHDMTISYKNLPLKMIELTRYSFRREQRGELVGLRRLRAFTMPDMHTLTRNMEEALSEFLSQYKFCIKTLKSIGLDETDFEIAIRFTKQFYEENKNLIENIIKIINKPVLVEIWESRFFYFVLKFEFNFIDNLGKASALSTVQIDVENAERYDIKYTNSNGDLEYPTILHCSPSGAIERCIYAILEKAAFSKSQKKLPTISTWLCPTQIRLIPVSSNYLGYLIDLSKKITCRVDIDDRDITLNKKIRDASMEWIPFIVVIGEKEIKENKVNVTIRSKSTPLKTYTINISIEELNSLIKEEINGYPYKVLPLNKYLSKRPKFI